MTQGKLIIDSAGGEPTIVEIDVTSDQQSLTINITPTEVKIHTLTEPVRTQA